MAKLQRIQNALKDNGIDYEIEDLVDSGGYGTYTVRFKGNDGEKYWVEKNFYETQPNFSHLAYTNTQTKILEWLDSHVFQSQVRQ